MIDVHDVGTSCSAPDFWGGHPFSTGRRIENQAVAAPNPNSFAIRSQTSNQLGGMMFFETASEMTGALTPSSALIRLRPTSEMNATASFGGD